MHNEVANVGVYENIRSFVVMSLDITSFIIKTDDIVWKMYICFNRF